MTVPEAIKLFTSEMINEIGHATNAHGQLYDDLVRATKNVAQTVTETYEAEKAAQ